MLRCESCWYWNEIFMWSMHGSMWACCNKMYHSPRNLMHEEFHKSQIPTNKRWRDLERQITQQTRPPTWHFDEYQYIWTPAEALSHGRHVISLTHLFVPYTEYTHKYNYAGINTSGKWLDPQLYSSKLFPMASHRTATSGPFINQNILHWSQWALHLTQAQTSYINACLIFATHHQTYSQFELESSG